MLQHQTLPLQSSRLHRVITTKTGIRQPLQLLYSLFSHPSLEHKHFFNKWLPCLLSSLKYHLTSPFGLVHSVDHFLSSQGQPHSSALLDSSPSTTKEILSLFTNLKTQIFEAFPKLQEVLDQKDAKKKINQEIRSKDSALLAFANKLKHAERILDILVDDYSEYRSNRKRLKLGDGSEDDDSLTTSTVSSKLKLSDILSYAHRISYTTFSPPEFGAGQAPLRRALPPAPQDEQMRASQLYNFADLDIGLPKSVETKDKTIEAIIEPPTLQPVDTN